MQTRRCLDELMGRIVTICCVLVALNAAAAPRNPADDDTPEDNAEKDAEVVITAPGLSDPTGRTLVDEAKVEARGAEQVAAAVELEPGVEVARTAKGTLGLQLRGFDERSTLVLVDGFPLREAYGGALDLSSLGSRFWQALRVERGVTSVLYGSGSSGGVLSLEGRLPRRAWEIDAGAALGHRPDLEPWAAGAYARGGLARGRVQASLGVAWDGAEGWPLSRGFRTTKNNASFHERGGVRDGSEHQRGQLATRVRVDLAPDWILDLTGVGFLQSRGIPTSESAGVLRNWRYDPYATGLVGARVQHRHRRCSAPSLEQVDLGVWATIHDDVLMDYEGPGHEVLTTNPDSWFRRSAYHSRTLGTQAAVAARVAAHNRMEAGVSATWDAHRQRSQPVSAAGAAPQWESWEQMGAWLFHGALEDVQGVGPFSLLGGVGVSAQVLEGQMSQRLSDAPDRRVHVALDGRVGATVRLPADLEARITAGHKSRFPTLKELYSGVAGGNAALRPERAWMLDGGLRWQPALAGGWFPFLRAGVYWSLLRDLIDRSRDRYQNLGRAVLGGVEIDGGVRWRGLELRAWYTWLHARDEVSDRSLAGRSPHRVGGEALWTSPWGMALALQLLWWSGQDAWYFDTPAGSWVRDRLPGDVLLGARIAQRLSLGAAGELEVFLRGDNLLDADWVSGSFAPQRGVTVLLGVAMKAHP